MTTKETFVAELIEEGFSLTENLQEAIYILESGEMVWGEFDYGMRGIDHRMMENFTELDRDNGYDFWEEVHYKFNVVMMVPETKYAMYFESQQLSEIQKQLIKKSGYEIELHKRG